MHDLGRIYSKHLRVRLTEEQDAKLNELAAETRRDRSEVIRILIDLAYSTKHRDIGLDLENALDD